MPSTAHKGTAHRNRVLPCADLGVVARVGKGYSSKSGDTLVPIPEHGRYSPAGPMVPHAKVCGRLGRRRHKIEGHQQKCWWPFLFPKVLEVKFRGRRFQLAHEFESLILVRERFLQFGTGRYDRYTKGFEDKRPELRCPRRRINLSQLSRCVENFGPSTSLHSF